jgi:uncharacterized protein YjbI with pentapeptide repeats
METPARNHFVRPRVRPSDPDVSGTLLLEDAISERLARGTTGVVWVSGASGSGLRTALRLLDLRFDGDPRIFIDPEPEIAVRASRAPTAEPLLRVRFCRDPGNAEHVLELAPWSRDECIEYLLARHPARCASVMQRIARGVPPLDLEGVPLVLAAVLDALAADEALPGEFEALRAALARVFGAPNLLARARAVAFESIPSASPSSPANLDDLLPHAAWLRQIPVLLVLAAEALTILLEQRNGIELPTCAPDAELLRVVQPLLASSSAAREEAARMLDRGPSPSQPWAASLVHLEGPAALARVWPQRSLLRSKLPHLSAARLDDLQAAELDFSCVVAPDIRLRSARLQRCDFSDACLHRARCAGASLRAARMHRTDAKEADLSDADLEGVDAFEARFDGASLDRANLRGAILAGATLEGSSLRGTRAQGADCASANLARLDLRAMQGLPARFAKAGLMGANLEGQSGEGLDFSAAELTGALLSGTRFPRANFQGAILRNTGLAWIDWEGASLFDADLTGASFHLGSSRSGLVFNAPAGWGTRTGFYSDEMKDQSFKAPEEVRKANLKGADLRKAVIFQTDFYLVDLRGALYTPDQEKHLRGCGAILGS